MPANGSTGPVGVGLIGAGNISEQYLDSLGRFPDLQVLFVADLDTDRARARAAKYDVPGAGSVDEFLARPDIEIAVNLTNPAAHVDLGLRALSAGKHVWSEKPLGTDRESARALLDHAKASGLRLACAPDTVLGPGLQEARRAIESGSIGRPLTAVTMMQGPGPDRWHPDPEFLFAAGGGPLFDIGPYYLTTLVCTLGPVSKVTAAASLARRTRVIQAGPRAGTEFPVEVPTHIGALIEFAGGQSAQCTFSFESGLSRDGLVEISGSDGTAVLPNPNNFDGTTSLWNGTTEPVQLASQPTFGGRGLGVLELARAIRAGRTERASGELAYHVLDIMISIAESAEQHQSITVHSTAEVPPVLPSDWDPLTSTL
ncbi:Gfo/Idh/MocA family oxidoreductase [Kribbella solani]|uniref:Gfo/Idh/MocA family protein n=1 Tax=Kribbella solani TaxID=236067 RepID=UPI0029B43EB1|nr:Gfo/Idh/MocA family oxidoreductase [Kribbella solani]MDX3006252.1 Gfo/Idh/MocA family oxidoreductase [Kribbella solani]